MRRLLSIVASVAFLALTVWAGMLLARQAAQLDPALDYAAGWVLAALAAKLAAIGLLGLKFRQQCRLCGLALAPREWLGLSSVTTFHAYLSPAQTGHALRALYLRRQHGFGFERYALQTVGVNLLELAAAGVLGLLLAASIGRHAWPLLPVLILAIVVPGASFAAAALGGRLAWLPAALRERARRLREGSLAVLAQRRGLVSLSLLSFGSILARGLGLYCSFRACGYAVDALPVLLVECVRTAALMVTITPGNLGLTEGLIAGCAALLGIAASAGLAAAVVSRLLSMALHAVFGLWYSRVLFGAWFRPSLS